MIARLPPLLHAFWRALARAVACYDFTARAGRQARQKK